MPTRSASVSSSRLNLSVTSGRPCRQGSARRRRGRAAPSRSRSRRAWPRSRRRARGRARAARARSRGPSPSRPLVVGQLQPVEQAVEERDLAARHAERVDLFAAEQVDLPLPLPRARVPLVAVGDGDRRIARRRISCGSVQRERAVARGGASAGTAAAARSAGRPAPGRRPRLLADVDALAGERGASAAPADEHTPAVRACRLVPGG